MRIAIIGGTGHIGSYLTPMLFEAGHTVICVCRKARAPYREHKCWQAIEYLQVDRAIEEQKGIFGQSIAGLNPQVVIDLTCYHLSSAEQLVRALSGRVEHFLHCGTIWVHGHSTVVPTTEGEPRRPFGEYGISKAAIEAWLLKWSSEHDFPATILHPGHLVGPGWAPVNPQGNFNVEVFSALKHGREVTIPNFGMETVHHVHAEDVARAFLLALDLAPDRRGAALGEAFHVVSAQALTLRGYAERVAEWFQMPANLRFLAWEQWKQGVSAKDAAATEDHIRHSPNCSIDKARRLLGYEPKYSSLEAVRESVNWLIQHERI